MAWIALSILQAVFFGSNVIADGQFSTEFQMFRQNAIQIAALVMPFAAWSAKREPTNPVKCALFFSLPSIALVFLGLWLSIRAPTPISKVWLPTATMLAPLIFPPAIFVIFAWTRRFFTPAASWFFAVLGVVTALLFVQLLAGFCMSFY